MSGFKMAMQGFDAPTAAVDRAHAKRVLEDILKPGDQVELKYLRGGATRTATLPIQR